MSDSMIKKLMDLNKMSLAELRGRYLDLFGEEPYFNANAAFMIPRIAYRMQEQAFGGLPKRVRNKLNVLSGGNVKSVKKLLPGSRIVKDYKGRRLEVEVLVDGFSFDGLRYKSLSAIAKAVTGTHWNGKKFFEVGGDDE